MSHVRIKEEKKLHEGHAVLKELVFDVRKKDGEWEEQTREVFDHGNAATVLLYNLEQKTVVLTRQFRLASFVNGNADGMLLEACAGLLEEGEAPEKTMLREVEEETGYVIPKVEKVFEAYTSPGANTELVHYYIAPYSPRQKQSEGGGLEEEGEDVQVVEMPFDKAFDLLKTGRIKDAKTIILLLYLQQKLAGGAKESSQ